MVEPSSQLDNTKHNSEEATRAYNKAFAALYVKSDALDEKTSIKV